MQVGLTIPMFNHPTEKLASTLRALAGAAEKAGFYSLWVMDHFFQIPPMGAAEQNMLEGYSTLTYLAAVTEKIKLGTMVTGITYRHPGVLVKTATTLDVMSGGRSYFGIGAAWFEREHVGLGVPPYPALKERFERLEENIQIALQMWSGEVKPYHGKHYRLEETLCLPQPLSRPHPPILIGGTGEKKTLLLVARYAQGCNIFCMEGPDFVRQKLDVLRQHCAAEKRNYADIEKTGLGIMGITKNGGDGSKSPQQFLDWLGSFAEAGIEHMVLGVPNLADPAAMELLATEVIPHLGRIKAAV